MTDKIQSALTAAGLDGLLVFDEKNLRDASGFAFTDGAMLIGRDRAFLYTDSRYIEAAEKSVGAGIELRTFGGGKKLSDLILADMTDCGMTRDGAEEESLPHGRYLFWEKRLGVSLIPSQRIFNELRAAKTEAEQENMRRAQRIAELALTDVLGTPEIL